MDDEDGDGGGDAGATAVAGGAGQVPPFFLWPVPFQSNAPCDGVGVRRAPGLGVGVGHRCGALPKLLGFPNPRVHPQVRQPQRGALYISKKYSNVVLSP